MPVLPGTGARSLAVAVVVAVVIAGYVLLARHTADETAAPDGRSGFQERAREAKLAFRMHDLPKEQGERFRINLYDHGSGLAVGDYDNDGREDIYFLNQLGPNALYRNRGDGTFVDVTAQAGVALGDRISVAATFADYDNDGWADLFVTTTRGGNVLWHNRGDGTFEDVTAAAGLSHVGHSQTPVFFDYDNDGYLDLFLTNTAQWTTDVFDSAAGYFEGKADLEHLQTSPTESNILYHNNGDGTFTDQTDRTDTRPDTAWGDRLQGVRLRRGRTARPLRGGHALGHVDGTRFTPLFAWSGHADPTPAVPLPPGADRERGGPGLHAGHEKNVRDAARGL